MASWPQRLEETCRELRLSVYLAATTRGYATLLLLLVANETLVTLSGLVIEWGVGKVIPSPEI